MTSDATTASLEHARRLAKAPYRAFEDLTGSILHNIAAAAAVSDTRFLLGGFVDILLLDTDDHTVRRLDRDREDIRIQPAGLAYSPKHGVVISTDYLLNKVTAWRLSGDRLSYLWEIPGLISPEGAAIDDATGILAIAEFDGNGASAWQVDFETGAHRRLWRREIQQAHGIAIADRRVYVTGLIDRRVFVLDRDTGADLDAWGSIGWDPGKLEYLWPTSIHPDGRGNFIVADAETGFVSIIDPSDKAPIAVIGGARPGRGGFAQPYTAVVGGNTLLIVSNKDERFALFDYPSLEPRYSLVRNPSDWQGYEDVPDFVPRNPNDYMWDAGPKIELFGTAYSIYSSALSFSGEKIIRIGNAFGLNGYTYHKMLDFIALDGCEYFVSPYTQDGPIVIKRAGGRVYAVSFPSNVGRDRRIFSCWISAGGIHCAHSEGYNLEAMRELLDEFIATAEANRGPDGLLAPADLQAAIAELNRAAAPWIESVALSSIFTSDQGQRFLTAYERTSGGMVDPDLVMAGADLLYSPRGASLHEMSLASIAMPSDWLAIRPNGTA